MHFYESVPERRYPSIKLEFVLFPVLKSKKEKKEKKERRKRRGKKSKKKGSYSTMKTAF